jgi:hypothetical protein
MNPTIEVIREAFVKLTKIAMGAEKSGPMNIFAYFSGHGASVPNLEKISKLNIACPTVLSQEEFATLANDLPLLSPI